MNKDKEFIPALGYNQLTALYDKVIDWTMPEEKFRNKLIQYLLPQPVERILELGFGTGQNLILSLKNEINANYYGLDVDPKVMEIAKDKLQRLNLSNRVQLDLYDGNIFPYENNFFEKVFSCLVFHQLKTETKKLALKEIYRVLRPNGTLLICDWGKPSGVSTSLGFYLVQLLDGFETTTDNRKGLMPEIMESAKFKNVQQIDVVDTKIGTLRYTIGTK